MRPARNPLPEGDPMWEAVVDEIADVILGEYEDRGALARPTTLTIRTRARSMAEAVYAVVSDSLTSQLTFKV